MSESVFVRVRVAGPYACFSRPEMKVERVSYDVMTPSAARGVLDAILWRPEMRWIVRRIEVLKPIRFVSVRRNEIQSKIAHRSVLGWMEKPDTYEPQPAGAGSGDNTPRNTLALRDVAYIVEATPNILIPDPENTPVKYMAMFNRRVERGQCFHRPYLGCREFACEFSPPDPAERPIPESCDLGWMLYDIVFSPDNEGNRPVFFQARIENGVMDAYPDHVLPDPDLRKEVIECSSRP
jgi:CRISPR-associated protein Cas5d